MLNTMRNLSKSFVSKALMILLVISFAAWGIGDIFTGNNSANYAAKVGNEAISIAEFQQQRQLVSRQLAALGMKDLPKGQLEMSVIRQLVQQKLALMQMKDMGLVVNEALIAKMLADLPDFKNKDGKFDSKLFKTFLDRQRLTEAAFIAQLKRDVAGRFLTDSLNMEDATAPSSVVALSHLIQGETRDAVLFTIPAKKSENVADEAALTEFYEQNKSIAYLSPETRTLEYVVLTEAEIDALADKSVTAEMVAERMKAKPELNQGLARMQLKKDQREEVLHTLGNSIEDELAAGKTMAEAFTKAGITTTTRTLDNATAELAKTSADDVVKTVAEQGFGLSEGEISRLISSKKGALLMVSAKKITAASPKPFEQVKADVAAKLASQSARDGARTTALAVKTELLKAPNWQAVASAHGLGTRAISRVARPVEGKQPTAENIPPTLQQALFERNVGEVAGPLTLDNGDQMIALVTQSHLPDAKTAAPEKAAAPIGNALAQDVQNRAYQAFQVKHNVTVNPALLRPSAEE